MIPVKPKPEPSSFDAKVRQKGSRWIQESGLDSAQPVPIGKQVKPLWQVCLPELLEAYGRICAYVCIYIEEVTGSATVEHFVPKSRRLDLAYEWSNYRLVCGAMNGSKSNFEDVLDPFTLKKGTFQLNLVSGAILVNTKLTIPLKTKALETVSRLKLDSPKCRRLRLRYFDKYIQQQIDAGYLQEQAPFVYLEMKRQKLL